ncbi:hypothetical protein [Bartonella sp. AU55XJBT]|uniref:hypothetical protein n=1 Tax=Bartonella sp. AU55XJBT TaxID=3019091 RepID=UPI00235E95B1|nr:hypothetical protein [Bartonella sp. AU55XJBT]
MYCASIEIGCVQLITQRCCDRLHWGFKGDSVLLRVLYEKGGREAKFFEYLKKTAFGEAKERQLKKMKGTPKQ